MYNKLIILLFVFFFPMWGYSQDSSMKMTGEQRVWHKMTFSFQGPYVSEGDSINPFLNYRMDVTFRNEETGETFVIPGYFAADGDAANTSAESGNIWRVHFVPNATGQWNYSVSFRTDDYIAVRKRASAGKSAGFFDGKKGSFFVKDTDKTGNDNRAHGFLRYNGTRYLTFTGTGEVFLKMGPDSPENFLAYKDFDGTFHNDGYKDKLVKTWEPHLKDWKEGDPCWKANKGKSIIGVLNYLSSKGLNSFSFITMNIAGDDQNVFPYVDYTHYDRFDCSKLDQWEILFEHADKLGMFMHFKLMETENQGLLDHGAIGMYTQLYYREMIARFSHHLALNWNICEEAGDWEKYHMHPTFPMNTDQRLCAAKYFADNDPYKHHIVIHNGQSFTDLLEPNSPYTGLSLQTEYSDFRLVHPRLKYWINESKKMGKQLAVSIDEPGDARHALLPDSEDASHDIARKNGLWGGFMAGSWGSEWYFGYAHKHSDLSCQDYRSRDLFWNQCVRIKKFFENYKNNLATTENHDELVSDGDYCLCIPNELYFVYLKNGSGHLDLTKDQQTYTIKWFNPRKESEFIKSKISIKGGQVISLTNPKSEKNSDWALILELDK